MPSLRGRCFSVRSNLQHVKGDCSPALACGASVVAKNKSAPRNDGKYGEESMIEELTHEQILRYSRHLLMPEVGLKGQIKLKNSSALIIGTGGLGSPVALYFAPAGAGGAGR